MALQNNVDASFAATFVASSFATSVGVSAIGDVGSKISADAVNDTNFTPVKAKKANGDKEDFINTDNRISMKRFFEVKSGTLGWIDDLFEKDINGNAINIGAGKKFDFTTNSGKALGLNWGLVIAGDCFIRYPNLVWDNTNSEYVAVADYREAFLYHWKNGSCLKFICSDDTSEDTTMYEEKMLDYLQAEYIKLGGTGVRTV